jgi:hypothetical protein
MGGAAPPPPPPAVPPPSPPARPPARAACCMRSAPAARRATGRAADQRRHNVGRGARRPGAHPSRRDRPNDSGAASGRAGGRGAGRARAGGAARRPALGPPARELQRLCSALQEAERIRFLHLLQSRFAGLQLQLQRLNARSLHPARLHRAVVEPLQRCPPRVLFPLANARVAPACHRRCLLRGCSAARGQLSASPRPHSCHKMPLDGTAAGASGAARALRRAGSCTRAPASAPGRMQGRQCPHLAQLPVGRASTCARLRGGSQSAQQLPCLGGACRRPAPRAARTPGSRRGLTDVMKQACRPPPPLGPPGQQARAASMA